MCMQCIATAATVGGSASGIRAWLSAKGFAWLTPRGMRLVTIALVSAAVIISSVGLSSTGGGPPTRGGTAAQHATPQR